MEVWINVEFLISKTDNSSGRANNYRPVSPMTNMVAVVGVFYEHEI